MKFQKLQLFKQATWGLLQNELTLSLAHDGEFPAVVIKAAAELVANSANNMQSKYPDGVLPSFQQFVDIPMRRGTILDLCYGNITDAYVT